MKKIIVLLVVVSLCFNSFGQADTAEQKVYRMHLKYELPGSLAAIFLSTAGFRKLEKVSSMTAEDVAKLNINNINSFDRSVATLDPAGFASARSRSDLFLNISLFSPAILAIDKRIRKDWLDLITLYLVTHAVDNALYFAGAFSFRRARPLTYNPRLDIAEKIGNGKSNSFFSGHTSFSAAATFFAAKVYTDYHHIKGWKRLLFYAAASVPPAIVGYNRMRSGSHFKTDVMMGFVAGAASGIVVPELHRIKKKHENLSFSPFYTPGSTGLTVTVGL